MKTYFNTDLVRAKSLLREENFKSALSIYDRYLESYPRDPAARLGRIRALIGLNRVDEKTLFSDLGLLGVVEGDYQYVLGEFFYHKKDLLQAEIRFRSSLSYDDHNIDATLGLAKVLIKQARKTESCDLLIAANEQMPGSPVLIAYLCIALMLDGQVNRAINFAKTGFIQTKNLKLGGTVMHLINVKYRLVFTTIACLGFLALFFPIGVFSSFIFVSSLFIWIFMLAKSLLLKDWKNVIQTGVIALALVILFLLKSFSGVNF